MFVRGNYQSSDEQNEDENIPNDNDEVGDDENLCASSTYSKESCVARLHRTLVYQLFIRDLRMSQCGWSGEGPVPDDLTAVSWMDGAHGQLQLITSEENQKEEDELKIRSSKHSAARTVVEQAADCAPNFKFLKKDLKTMEVPHECMNPIVKFLKEKLDKLERDNILKLKSHKKKALLFALPNMPAATGAAFTVPNVRRGFIYNGQLDAKTTSVPSFKNLINTFRGNITDSCLEQDRKKIMEDFFEEMYFTGEIKESTFDNKDIPMNVDSKGNEVPRSNDISRENRHRAKL